MSALDNDQVIELSQLLSQPIISTLEADLNSAKRFVKFLTTYSFEEASNLIQEGDQIRELEDENSELPRGVSKPSKLKMVTFLYRQIDPVDRLEKLFQVQVPLISLIPLPLLQIEKAEFDFNIHIVSETDLTTEGAKSRALLGERSNAENETQTQYGKSFKGLKARLSPSVGRSESGEIHQTTDANMKVKLQMRQADLPGGLAYWMSTFNNATSLNQVELPQPDSKDESP
ncbi:DUF2589 domain-containing protein [Okeania hirsuta]|uniref:DUF2589 domain-containing protein n=1 Tax=Okeania hirsuta TaxID=1458930 RepID=A0A3N6PB38_9CYAN|nr:DUF2589 domain-containing protein [Okeania hirsuta]RQH40802.1 DUF2589 domain-containing protein [Okeania hirsuta]